MLEPLPPPAHGVETPPTTPPTTTPPAHETRPPALSDHGYRQPYTVDLVPLHAPWTDSDATIAPFDPTAFHHDPIYDNLLYRADCELDVYHGKQPVRTQQPWVNAFRGLYRPGQLQPARTWFGPTNPVAPHFLVYGDYRVAAAHVEQNNADVVTIANRLNLELDLKLTATERFHAFVSPMDVAGQFTRVQINNGRAEFIEEFDPNFDTVFFEGDVGSILGGAFGNESPWDLPVALGYYPWLAQNGVWFSDVVLGVAVTVPARNAPALDWSNFDLTLFSIFDELNSPAFPGFHDVQAHGGALFLDAYGGYVEAGYAYLHDQTDPRLSYHNASLAYTRRIRDIASTSLRAIFNEGQTGPARTADGQLLLWENSLITRRPSHLIPYCNVFAGFGRPQSVARAAGSGGVLFNTGILFETDGLNNTPTLDATGANTYGMVVGLNLLQQDFRHQLVLESGIVKARGAAAFRNAAGDQYGAAARYQHALNHAWILRLDALYGVLENAPDIAAFRTELRWKF